MTDRFPSVRDMLPHEPPMVLLDRILASDDKRTVCEVTIREGAPFVVLGGVCSHVTLEYMAQCVGVGAGLESARQGEEPRLGFLVGCREMEILSPFLPVGSTLRVIAENLWGGEELGHFRCEVRNPEQVVSRAILSVARFSADDFPGHAS